MDTMHIRPCEVHFVFISRTSVSHILVQDGVDSDKLQASERGQKSRANLVRSGANGIVPDQVLAKRTMVFFMSNFLHLGCIDAEYLERRMWYIASFSWLNLYLFHVPIFW